MSGPDSGALYYGDCLDWMSRWDDETVDLIYLDPPFNSSQNYNMLYSAEGETAQYRAFSDTWTWDSAAAKRFDAYEGAVARPAHGAVVGLKRILGPSGMLAYLTYMAERLEHMHRLLKPSGSIYLHCDPTASHYLKLVMDAIFGARNFRNEIVWSYRRWPSKSNHFQTMHDIVLFYVRGAGNTFHVSFEPPSSSYLKRFGGKTQVLDPITKSRKLVVDKPTKGMPQRDVWNLSIIAGSAKERLGYPTQKPLALLERIIRASSNPGDLVLDPFCGCGTTIEAASKLERRWAGIDISSFAIDLIREKRLKDRSIPAKGIPTDLASARHLLRDRPFDFESWAVTRVPGFAPNSKQVADGGVDGRATLDRKPDNWKSRLALAQVKGGKFSLSKLRDFIHVTVRDKAALGCFITLEARETAAAKTEMANTGRIRVSGQDYPRMQLWPIADYFDDRLPRMPAMRDPYTGKSLGQYGLFSLMG